MRELAKTFSLCHKLIGLDDAHAAGPCSAYEAQRCRGACVGAEPPIAHAIRAVQALSRLRRHLRLGTPVVIER